MKLTFATLALCICSIFAAHAQEATASKALDTTESMLSRRVEVLRALMEDMGQTVSDSHTKVNAIIQCNNKGAIYAPTQAGHDAQGCIVPAPPPGTTCGAYAHSKEYGGQVVPCQGYHPPNCPPGYKSGYIPIKGGKSGQSISMCFKT